MTHHLIPRLAMAAVAALTIVSLAACDEGGGPLRASAPAATAAPASADAPASLSTSSPPLFPALQDAEPPSDVPSEVPDEFRIVWEAWQLLLEDYVDRTKLDPKAFSEAAIRGMLRVLEDIPERSSLTVVDRLHLHRGDMEVLHDSRILKP